MGLTAKCDGCKLEEPMKLAVRGAGHFVLPTGWKYRPAGVADTEQNVGVNVACSTECLMKINDSGPGSGPHKIPPIPPTEPKPAPKKTDTRGRR